MPGEDDGVVPVRPPDCDYPRIVIELQGRLRFVRRILEFKEEVKNRHDYRGITFWLREHRLLRQEEERFVLDLLDGPNTDLDDWDPTTRSEFLDAAYAFSVRFGPKIWDRWVRQELTKGGWFVADFDQGKRHRADFLAYREGRWAQMTARVGGRTPRYIEKAAPRLLKFEPPELIISSVIVIPDIRNGRVKAKYAWGSNRPNGVRVLHLGELKESPELPFADPS